MDIFFQIGFIFIIATLGAYLSKLFRQPLIPAYILTGIVIGPFLGYITNSDIIATLSGIGIAFLLFIVGLEMDIKRLADIGLIASLGGSIQMILTFLLGFFIASLLLFKSIEAAYIGVVVAFSSTMIVVKLLSDKRELDTLHGRVIVGMLLMQDILAIAVLSFLTSMNEFSALILVYSLLKGISIVAVALICSKYLFPVLFRFAAMSQELLFMLAVSVCFFFSLIFSYIGFSIAIGAFVAGITLANLPYNIEIIGRVRSLRDFFATLFFVSLGLQLNLVNISALVYPLIVFTLVVVILKPLIVLAICGFYGYAKKTSFLAANYMAQISEFSLIIVAQGLLLGHISQNIFTLTILLAIVTITITSYLSKFDSVIYNSISKFLGIFDLVKKAEHLNYIPQYSDYEVILAGYDRIGYSVLRKLQEMKKKFIIVDFNPEIIKRLAKKKIPCLYGDIDDIEIIERLNLKKVELLISTIPDKKDSELLIKRLRKVNKKAAIFVTANRVEEALELYDAGADYVVLPHFLGGEHISVLLDDFSLDIEKIVKDKFNHIKELRNRMDLGHEHPLSI